MLKFSSHEAYIHVTQLFLTAVKTRQKVDGKIQIAEHFTVDNQEAILNRQMS